jgi:DNA-binding NtrC family response regulator
MRPLQILIVDDDSERRREVGDLLRAAGHRPVEASDAGTASEALAVPGLDLVVLDLQARELDMAALRNAIAAPSGAVAPDSLDDAERRHIAATLRHTGGNKRQAALLLGISRSTLLNKVRRYHLE